MRRGAKNGARKEGMRPWKGRVSKARLQAKFDASICEGCPVRDRCVAYGKKQYQYTHKQVGYRRGSVI